jgi:hypothetical protein
MAEDQSTLRVPAELKREARIKAAQIEWIAEDAATEERPKRP